MSQGCPLCFGKLETVDATRDRVKHCKICDKFLPRDSCSGHLMARLGEMVFNGEELPPQLDRYS
jgi:hypothetical protein